MEDEATNDFLLHEKWRTMYFGFGASKSVWYYAYRCFIFCLFVYMLLMAGFAAVLKPDKELIVSAVHFMIGTIFGIWSLATRVVAHKCLKKVRAIIRSGVFTYENEDDEVHKLRASIAVEIHTKGAIFLPFYVIGAVTNAVLFPLSQLLLLEDTGDPVVNPYYPTVFYQPYDTRTTLVFCSCFLLSIVYFPLLYGVAVAINWIYLSFAVTVKTHFKLLNYSLKNIQHRAFVRYTQEFGEPPQGSLKILLRTREFQRCLYTCLRSNIQHHQELIKLVKMFKPFYGSYLVDLFTASPTLFGALLYLIYQMPPWYTLILLIGTFVTEQFTVIYVCMMGEGIINESEMLFKRLYRIEWYNYGKRFNRTLHTMMSNTVQPSALSTLVFGVYACNESYGDICSAMYKLCNLVRSSDST